MDFEDFQELMERFTELDYGEMDIEDNMAVTLAIMKMLRSIESIIDKYNPKEQPKKDDEFNFNEFWRFIDGEQDGK